MEKKIHILPPPTLPNGWTYCSLEEVVISQKGKRPQKLSAVEFEGSVPYLDIKAIETGKIDNYADSTSSILITEKDLIVVWDGSRSGWVGKGQSGALGSTLVVLTPVLIDYDYLYFFLKSKFEYINSNIKGSGIPHVNQDIFWNITIPIAPLAEQKRIASKVEESFLKLTTTQASLEKIPDIIGASKQKILKRAFLGELTNDWRRANPELSNEKVLAEYNKDANGWHEVKAKECCIKISNGSTPKGKRFEIDKGIPFLKVYNIVDQKIDFSYKPQFIDELTHRKQSKSIVYPDDVLINIVGPPLGKVAIIPHDYSEWNMNQALVLFRPEPYLIPEYLYYFFLEGTQIKQIENQYRGSAGQSNISLTQCRNFDIKIPPIEEQNEIVKKIAEQFDELDKILEKNASIKKSISTSLDKILEEAFNGEFMSQNPKDDSAILLLDRIRTEKIYLSNELLTKRRLKAKAKNIIMTNKKTIPFIDILKKKFGKKEFTFKDIEIHTDLEYEALKDEVYKLLENDLQMEFNEKSKIMHFKLKAS